MYMKIYLKLSINDWLYKSLLLLSKFEYALLETGMGWEWGSNGWRSDEVWRERDIFFGSSYQFLLDSWWAVCDNDISFYKLNICRRSVLLYNASLIM